jgi:hypothetical protein
MLFPGLNPAGERNYGRIAEKAFTASSAAININRRPAKISKCD